MMGKIKTYRDLDIWNAGIRLVKDVYKLTEKFPEHELYGLVPFLKSKFHILSFPRRRESRFLNLDSGSRPE
jgi:hypothetical protein